MEKVASMLILPRFKYTLTTICKLYFSNPTARFNWCAFPFPPNVLRLVVKLPFTLFLVFGIVNFFFSFPVSDIRLVSTMMKYLKLVTPQEVSSID